LLALGQWRRGWVLFTHHWWRREKEILFFLKNGTEFKQPEIGSICSYYHKINNSQDVLKIEVIIVVVGF
jgi:hypothetical protein